MRYSIHCLYIFLLTLLVSSLFTQEQQFKAPDKKPKFKNREKYNFYNSNSVIVWGSSSADEDITYMNETIADLVNFRITRWIGKTENIENIITDKELKQDTIDKYNLILVGDTESNSVIKTIDRFLPFTIEGNQLLHNGKSIILDEFGIIYFYPNPLNPDKMIMVVTANNVENLRFIPKKEDYVIFTPTDYSPQSDRFMEVAMGDFDKKWNIKELNMLDNTEVDTGENQPILVADNKEYPAPDWAKHGVMYEIFVRSFCDSNGDGIGDLKGITSRLDYLNDGNPETTNDLGIKLIWLMPVFDSPSYHGYDVSDYYKINHDYGTNEDFQELLREAHKRGIKIITDLILNHCSSQHALYRDAYNNPDSKYDKWFYFSNETNTRTHNWYFRNDQQDRAMLDPFMPAWNVNNPEVQDYLFAAAKYWIDPNNDGDFSDGIDGYRCDYAMGPPHEFWKNFRQAVKSTNPDVLLLAEAWTDLNAISQYFDNEFDMAFDFPFQGAITGAISGGSGKEIISTIESEMKMLPAHALMNRFANNHDMNRIANQFDEATAKLTFGILLTLPQMPMLYYGDEIGMKGQKDPYDEGIRRPMEWCADNKCKEMATWYPVWEQKPDGISVEEQNTNPVSLLSFIRNIISIRDKSPVETGTISFNKIYETSNSEKEYQRAISYTIEDSDYVFIVVANLYKEKELSVTTNAIDFNEFSKNIVFSTFNDPSPLFFDNKIVMNLPEKSFLIINCKKLFQK